MAELQLVLLAMLGGLLRFSPALLWIAVGDCITQRSGNFNFGLEGIVAVGAVSAVAATAATGNPYLGLLAAAAAGFTLALCFALCCQLPAVNSITVGIAFFIGGVALARFAGTDLLSVVIPPLPVLDLGAWLAIAIEPNRTMLQLSVFLLGGLVLAVVVGWLLQATRLGLVVTAAGSSNANAGLRVVGSSQPLVRVLATATGGGLRRHRRGLHGNVLPWGLVGQPDCRGGAYRADAGVFGP